MPTFRDLRTQEDVAGWTAGLLTRYPERGELMQHITAQLKALPFATLQVVELGPGPGLLAEVLLRELPQMNYTGLDSSELLLTFARTKLAPFGRRASLLGVDLNTDDWLEQLPGEIQAIISLQAMHDLGMEPVAFDTDETGHTVVKMHQVVHDLAGQVISEGRVEHVYQIEDGLIKRMEIRKDG